MPKRLLKKLMVAEHKLMEHESLRFMKDALTQGNVWHLNRHSASRGIFNGLFWAFIPMPFQMIPAAFCAIYAKANLPLSVGLVWITNPLTTPPIIYATYKIGATILDVPTVEFSDLHWNNIDDLIIRIWKPLYLGSFITSISFASIGYTTVQYLWRKNILHQYKKRQLKRQKKSH